MKYFLSVIFFYLAFGCLQAQNTESEQEQVKKVVLKLFDGMRKGDSTMVHEVFMENADMHTVFVDENGNNQLRKGSLDRFLNAVGTPHDAVWDEPVWDMQINIDGALASVWTKYAFYAGKQFSHCGVDAFQLFKSDDGWKIVQITDTRQKEGCIIPEEIKKAHQ